jgi:hypothetical protein
VGDFIALACGNQQRSLTLTLFMTGFRAANNADGAIAAYNFAATANLFY